MKPKVLYGIGEKKSNSGRQWYLQNRVYSNEIAVCISANKQFSPFYEVNMKDLRIRKLTSKECWRLMGFDDEDWEKASKVCSESHLYKQAGNSIVVNTIEAIIKEML